MKSKISIFSSNQTELEGTLNFLEEMGFSVLGFDEVKSENMDELSKFQPDVILLDVEIKGTDGIELCYQLKNEKQIRAFVVLFAKHYEDYIQVEAFKAGADDYIIRPINPRLLIKRIEALLKRKLQGELQVKSKQLTHNSIKIDRDSYMVIKEGKNIMLPRKEFEMLYLLVNHPQKVFSREEIFDRVWKDGDNKNTRIIDVHVRKIRERVGQKIIKTVKGVGYQLA